MAGCLKRISRKVRNGQSLNLRCPVVPSVLVRSSAQILTLTDLSRQPLYAAKQRGLSLSSLILVLIIIGLTGVVGMQIAPAVVEFQSIKKAVVEARNKGNTVTDIENSFNKQANAGYITSISGKDLTIVQEEGAYVVSFAYDKKLHLFGPASLLLEFSGSTDNSAGR